MVLLITGAITPAKNISKTTLTDANARKEQYLSALKATIDMLSPNSQADKKVKSVGENVAQNTVTNNISICYCDNSNPERIIFNDVEKYAKEKNIALEILGFQGDVEKISYHGKGYGEGEITKYAMENSVLIKNDNYFLKLTGRLLIDNMASIAQNISNNKMYFNIPNHTRRDICDTRLYAMPVELYKNYFMDAYNKVNDDKGYYLEHAFSDVIKENKLVTYNFPKYPLYNGVSGSAGMKYTYSLWKSSIKNILSGMQFYRFK